MHQITFHAAAKYLYTIFWIANVKFHQPLYCPTSRSQSSSSIYKQISKQANKLNLVHWCTPEIIPEQVG